MIIGLQYPLSYALVEKEIWLFAQFEIPFLLFAS